MDEVVAGEVDAMDLPSVGVVADRAIGRLHVPVVVLQFSYPLQSKWVLAEYCRQFGSAIFVLGQKHQF